LIVHLLFLLLGSYLAGSVPFGLIAARRRGIDITKVGSGNIGATNALRVLGVRAGVAVLLLDLLKGLVPALLAAHLYLDHDRTQLFSAAAGGAAMVGHCLSPFLRFKGGKGVATGMGMLFGTTPLVAACTFGVFFLSLGITRYVSVSSIVAAFSSLLFLALFGGDVLLFPVYGLVVIFVMYRHRSNIQRLVGGTETRFTMRGGAHPPPEVMAEDAPDSSAQAQDA
jgi:acyl phosphate:glycerol-3-phosphate acyltransferase